MPEEDCGRAVGVEGREEVVNLIMEALGWVKRVSTPSVAPISGGLFVVVFVVGEGEGEGVVSLEGTVKERFRAVRRMGVEGSPAGEDAMVLMLVLWVVALVSCACSARYKIAFPFCYRIYLEDSRTLLRDVSPCMSRVSAPPTWRVTRAAARTLSYNPCLLTSLRHDFHMQLPTHKSSTLQHTSTTTTMSKFDPKTLLQQGSFEPNAILRGAQLTFVGANRALQNPALFTSEHYKQAALAVAAGIAIRLLVAIPVSTNPSPNHVE